MPKPNKYLPQDLDIEEDYNEDQTQYEPIATNLQCTLCSPYGQAVGICPTCNSDPSRRALAQGDVSSTSSWGCRHCTFDNAASSLVCSMCEQPRNAPAAVAEEQETPVQNEAEQARFASPAWVCEQCTYENESSAVTCAMCGQGDAAAEESEVWQQNSAVKFHFKSSRKGPKSQTVKLNGDKTVEEQPHPSRAPMKFVVERWTPEEVLPVYQGASTKLAQINLQCIFGLISSRNLTECATVCKSWYHVLTGPKATLWKDRFHESMLLHRAHSLPLPLVPSGGQAWGRLFGLFFRAPPKSSSFYQTNFPEKRLESSMWFPVSLPPVALLNSPASGPFAFPLVGCVFSNGRVGLWSGLQRSLKNHKALAYAAPRVATLEPDNGEEHIGPSFTSGSICMEVNRVVAHSSHKVVVWDISGFDSLALKCFHDTVDMKETKTPALKMVYAIDLLKPSPPGKKISEEEKEEIEWWKAQGFIIFAKVCPLPFEPIATPSLTAAASQEHAPSLVSSSSVVLTPTSTSTAAEVTSPPATTKNEVQQPVNTFEFPSLSKEESVQSQDWVIIDSLSPETTAPAPVTSPAPAAATSTVLAAPTTTPATSATAASATAVTPPATEQVELSEQENNEGDDEEEQEEVKATLKADEFNEEKGGQEERVSRPFEHTSPQPSRRRGLLILGFQSGQAELRTVDKGKLIARLSFGAGKITSGKSPYFFLHYPLLIRWDGTNVVVVNLDSALARAARVKAAEKEEQASNLCTIPSASSATLAASATSATTDAATLPEGEKKQPVLPVLSHPVVSCSSPIMFCQLWTPPGEQQGGLITGHKDGSIYLWPLDSQGARARIFHIPSVSFGCVHLSNELGLLAVSTTPAAVYVFNLNARSTWHSPLRIEGMQRTWELSAFDGLRQMEIQKDYLVMQSAKGMWLYIWYAEKFQGVVPHASMFQAYGPTFIVSVAGYIQVLNLFSFSRLIKFESSPSAPKTSTYKPLISRPVNDVRTTEVYSRKTKKSELSKVRQAKEKLVYKAQNRARDSKYIDEY